MLDLFSLIVVWKGVFLNGELYVMDGKQYPELLDQIGLANKFILGGRQMGRSLWVG